LYGRSILENSGGRNRGGGGLFNSPTQSENFIKLRLTVNGGNATTEK
jgi:hypothetical protein